jgi:uncharacterized damage-inducible protein DinB
MDAADLLRTQVARVDGLFKEVFANVTAEQAIWKLEGSTTNTIAQTFLHVYQLADRFTAMLSKQPSTVFERDGWGLRLGYDPTNPWKDLATVNPDAYRAYAAAVTAATQAALETLTANDLDREVTVRNRPQPLAQAITLVLIIHKLSHLGEIAALLGCQGVKGFPF